jgi:hypothetical protein
MVGEPGWLALVSESGCLYASRKKSHVWYAYLFQQIIHCLGCSLAPGRSVNSMVVLDIPTQGAALSISSQSHGSCIIIIRFTLTLPAIE